MSGATFYAMGMVGEHIMQVTMMLGAYGLLTKNTEGNMAKKLQSLLSLKQKQWCVEGQ